MDKILVKRCKYSDLDPYMKGFSALRYEHKDWRVEYGRKIFLRHNLVVHHIYNKRRDYTYIGIVDIGYLACFEPHENDECIVLKVAGRHMDSEEFFENVVFKAACDELIEAYEKRLEESKDKES